MLDQCNTLSSSNIILGDLNVHFDIPTNPLVLKTNIVLNWYSFYQAVSVPTHKLGHNLDIVTLRPTDDIDDILLLLPSYFHLIITVLYVAYLQLNLLTMLNSNSQELYVA